jgi:dolichol-phosphate mannosyltransferase
MYNIIVPTYNERENIRALLLMLGDTMCEMGVEYKIIVVDDNSPDGTKDVVSSMNLENVVLVSRREKSGLGTAYRAALGHCSFGYTVIMDGDLSHDPVYIKRMVSIRDGKNADIVVGTRYSADGGVYGWSLGRKIVSHGANNLARILLNLSVSDLTGSYRMYKTEVLRELMAGARSTGYSFQMELMFLAKRFKFTVAECPIIFHDRTAGRSKLSCMEIFMYLVVVISLMFRI